MKPLFNLVLFTLLTLTTIDSFAQPEFTLIATTANTVSSRALIEMPGLTGNPLAIIIATPIGGTETMNPHSIAAWYYNNKWNIFNTDQAVMPLGAVFKLQVFLKPDANHFLHVVTRENLTGGVSYIENPTLNRNPTAQVTIFQNHAPDNRPYYFNGFDAKAEYDPAAAKWYIKNVNGNPLYPNTAYNVVIISGGAVGSDISTTSLQAPSATSPLSKANPAAPNSPQRPCTKADEAQKEGSWGKQAADSFALVDASFPKEEYKPVLAKAQKVIELLKQANPQPTGIQAVPQRFISGTPYTKNGAMPFGVTARYFGFICLPDTPGDSERGQIVPNGETDTLVEVSFNSLGRMLDADKRSLGKTITAVNGDIMFFYPKETGSLKGLKILRPGANNPPQRDEAIIIAAGDRPPLKPVTREQYLKALEKFSRKKIKELEEAQQRSPSETRQSVIRDESNGLAKIGSAIARLSDSERQMQAILGNDQMSLSFAPESDSNGIRLVTFDRDFFDPALPRQTIQLITVYWNWNEKNAPKTELIRQFKQNFDFEALKQMLGK